MLAPDAPPVFADGWQAKTLVEARLGRPLPREAVALAINSNGLAAQLHIHVDCVAKPVAAALADYRISLDDHHWRAMTVPLAGRVYFARRLESADFRDASPFRLLADGIEGAKADMGAYSLAAVGASFDWKPRFYPARGQLLARRRRAHGGHPGSRLRNRTSCAIIRPARLNGPKGRDPSRDCSSPPLPVARLLRAQVFSRLGEPFGASYGALEGKGRGMRSILKFLLALGVVLVAQTHAFAFVYVDVDLGSQTMHVRSVGAA